MRLSKKIIKGEHVIFIDGKEYSISQAAKITGLPERTLHNGCKRKRNNEFPKWIKQILWKKKHGIGYGHKIHVAPDGEWLCVVLIMKITGLKKDAAKKRIFKYINGEIPREKLMQPLDETKAELRETMSRRMKRRMEEKKEEKQVEHAKLAGPLQPRRKVSEIGSSWGVRDSY